MSTRIPAHLDFREAADQCQIEFKTGLSLPPWSQGRATLWSGSLIHFVEWFIQPELPLEDFHREWYRDFCTHQFLCLLAPRDHSKTYSAACYYPLWRLYMDRNSTVLLAAASREVAQMSLRMIKRHIETNPRLKAGFGDIRPLELKKWTQSEIIVERLDFALKDPTVATVGVGGAILTRRVKNGMIVADDLVRDVEAQTAKGREKIHGWFHGTLIPVLEPHEQCIVIGTRQHDLDLYAELISNGAYQVKVYDAIQEEAADGTWVRSLWPAKWDLNGLAARRQAIGSIQFDRNYRNIILGDANSQFPLKWFTGDVERLRGCYDPSGHILNHHYTDELTKVIAVDLAAGKTESASFFVVLVLGLDENGDIRVLHMLRDHLIFPDQVRAVIDLNDRFLPTTVVVENNGYQQAFVEAVPAAAARVPIVQHTTTRKKNDPVEGVLMLQPLIEAGRIRFPMGDSVSQTVTETIVTELNRLGVAPHDDTVSALWFGVSRLVRAVDEPQEVEARVL